MTAGSDPRPGECWVLRTVREVVTHVTVEEARYRRHVADVTYRDARKPEFLWTMEMRSFVALYVRCEEHAEVRA